MEINFREEAPLISSDLRNLVAAAYWLAHQVLFLDFGFSILKYIASIVAIFLFILDNHISTYWMTNSFTSLLILYIFFSLPSWIFGIISDLEDEEYETDFSYESDEEEFLDPKMMEQDSVSATEEINNNDFIFGNFNQDSDLETVCVTSAISIKPEIEGCNLKISEINCSLAPWFLYPKLKDEEKFQKIGTDESKFFDLKFEIEFLFFKNILPSSLDSICISHIIFLASDLFHRLCLESGNLQPPSTVSSPVTVVFATPSELSSFIFDPGGGSKNVVHAVKSHIGCFSNFTVAAFSTLDISVLGRVWKMVCCHCCCISIFLVKALP